VVAGGGSLVVPTQERPGMGRWAVAADPQGALLGYFESEG
jgi:predicted enzyme related to lactoylglutathione lyase